MSSLLAKDWQKIKKFKEFGNAVNKDIPKKKQLFFTKNLDEVKENIKDTWKVLNMAMGNKSKTTNISCLKMNNNLLCDPQQIAN